MLIGTYAQIAAKPNKRIKLLGKAVVRAQETRTTIGSAVRQVVTITPAANATQKYTSPQVLLLPLPNAAQQAERINGTTSDWHLV